jgi:hypothetical protein
MPDELIEQPATPRAKAPLSKRVRAWSLILLICGGVLGLVYGGFHFLLRTFQPHASLDDRIYDAFLAFALLAIPARIFWVALGTRLSTGRWTKSPQERRQRAAQCAAKRPGTVRPSAWTWTVYCLKWANFTARQPEFPAGRRLAARGVLLLALLGYIAACLLPLVGVGAALDDDNTRVATAVFSLTALLIAILPWWLTRSLLRYKRTHPFMQTPPEELEQIRARHTQWHIQESRKPLRDKIIATVITLAVLTFWWLRATVFHPNRYHDSWITPAIYTPFALYAVLIQFRKPKASEPQATAQ